LPSKSARLASFTSKKNDLPGQVAAATKGRPQDPLQGTSCMPIAILILPRLSTWKPNRLICVLVLSGEKKRPQKAPPMNRLRSPVVPVVRSPGVNHMLSQASPKSVGVKRASSTPSQTPSKFPFLFFPLTIICSTYC
jgi:hypothetical protein